MNILLWQVIRTLQQAIPRCTQTQALAYANIVDREVKYHVIKWCNRHNTYVIWFLRSGNTCDYLIINPLAYTVQSTWSDQEYFCPPGWDSRPSQHYLQHLICQYPIYTPGWRETLRVKCFAQEHNTMILARKWLWMWTPVVKYHKPGNTPR